MKRVYPVLFVLISMIALNCQKELSSGPDNNNPTGTSITANLQGNVFDENGQPAMGVTIRIGNKTTTTNAKGYFRIVKASLDKKASLVVAEKTGYFKAYRSFIPTSGANNVAIKLIRKQLAGTVNSTAGGDVTLSNGSKISLPANGIVKAAGGSYNGTVNIYSSYIDPTSQDISMTVPGSFMADDKDGNRGALTSYGMLAVELESSSGEKLQVATGQTATLTMPIPSSRQSLAPSTISLWYVDEQTGIWKEEGSATKTGNNYVGQVKHFSFWNCDQFASSVVLTIHLQTNEGTPLVNILVRLTRPNGFQGYGWTDSLGQVSGLVPANEVLAMDIMAPSPCYNAIYSQNIGPFTQNSSVTATVSSGTPDIITLHGKLLNCSGAPVTNGYAIIYHDNTVRYAATNSSGDFTTTLVLCSGSSLVCQSLGVDDAAQQQGATMNVNLVSPSTDAGNISACGNSTLQFIDYNLDGINYNVSSTLPGDSLMCFTYDSVGVYDVNMSGFHPVSTNISFGFTSATQTAGTYPMHYLYTQGLSAQTPIPINVIVTNFPAAGGFYEGSFSGQFVNAQIPTPPHVISCSFRLRR